MRVAILVGVLTVRLIAGLYESDLGLNSGLDAGSSEAGTVHSFDGDNPPPPSWPG